MTTTSLYFPPPFVLCCLWGGVLVELFFESECERLCKLWFLGCVLLVLCIGFVFPGCLVPVSFAFYNVYTSGLSAQ